VLGELDQSPQPAGAASRSWEGRVG
jgi:hypothetical protein